MARIGERLAALRARGEPALVAYAMAGHPDAAGTLRAVRGMVRGGADVVELGFPFSDPLADGPAIQGAASASLAGGMDPGAFFALVERIRGETDVPLAVMTYANVLHRAGYGRFASRAARAGADGFVVPDMPVEESAGYAAAARRAGADTVFLAAPNTPGARMARIAEASTGFMYLVAVYGTTGQAGGVRGYALEALARARRAAAGRAPVGVGFGVAAPADARRLAAAGADAVVVGSAFVRAIGSGPRAGVEGRAAALARGLKRGALEGGRRRRRAAGRS